MSYDPERRRLLGLALKTARQRTGLSAAAASALIIAKGLKCSRGTLLAWERGAGRTSREPFCSDLNLIAAVYQCSVNDFFYNELQTALPDGNDAPARMSAAPAADGERLPRDGNMATRHPELAGSISRGASGL
jgi:transcriptional regulator with XRE-family HTH domain